jgi:hypothetical protein
MIINNNKEDLWQKKEEAIICHKSTNNKIALATMCGRNEEPQPSAVRCVEEMKNPNQVHDKYWPYLIDENVELGSGHGGERHTTTTICRLAFTKNTH